MKITDTGCDDFDRAAYNRYIIQNKLFTTGYLAVEQAVAHTPRSQSLPSWITLGELPIVGKKDWQQFGGEPIGLYEVADPEVVDERQVTKEEADVVEELDNE